MITEDTVDILLVFILYILLVLYCWFKSLGRHVWRCKARVGIENNSIANDAQDSNNTLVSIIDLILSITENQVILTILSAVAANNAKVYKA